MPEVLTINEQPSPASSIYVDANDIINHPEAPAEATDQTPISSLNTTKKVLQSSSSSVYESPLSEIPSPMKDVAALTPLRAHYLKKSLVTLQFARELDALASGHPSFPTVSPLSHLGKPFTPPPKDAPRLDLPFLRFMFRQFILTFPFVAAAPQDFFPMKLQPFVGSLIARNMSTTEDVLGMNEPGVDPELTSRRKILAKTEKYFSLLLGSAIKLMEDEEVVRLTQRDLDRLEILARKRAARIKRARDAFDVNIVCVRTVVEKGRVRSRVHEEFIVRTRRSHFKDIFVSRRYGDFKTLADELRKAHPEALIKPPPPKDRTTVSMQPSTSIPEAAPPSSNPRDNLVRSNTAMSSSDDLPAIPSSSSVTASKLAREKNRLTLRSYLHSLLTSPTIASSPVLKSFLLSGPTILSPQEEEDSKRREEADNVREEGRRKFAAEVASRVDGLRNAVRSVKGDIMGRDGLTRIFGIVKTTPNAKDLPADYQAVLEWGRITLASTIFQNFVASDSSSESLAGLKRIHGLMPYFVLKGILKISNPMAMIRGVLDLFLAQPFGQRSLLQRMFTSSLVEEARALQEDIAAVEEKVQDPMICQKVRLFVYAPKEIQAIYREDAAAERINILTAILRSNEPPLLNRPQMNRVMRSAQAHYQYTKFRETLNDSDDDDGPENEDAWLFEDLNVLAKLYTQLRDKEQLIDLIFEGTTADLLRDMISIFYAPLAQVYKAASIADSLGDLQQFITDLIRTVEGIQQTSQDDAHRTVQTLINLVERHEQAFYNFVHKVQSKGEGLFDSLMHWIELFLTTTRDGFSQKTSLEFILPHTGSERLEVIKEIDSVALYHYKTKIAYEEKVRRKFGRAQEKTDADGDDEAAQQLIDGVVKDLSFGELVKGDAYDIAAEQSESESESESSSEEETDSDSDDSGTPTKEPISPPLKRPRSQTDLSKTPLPSPKPAAKGPHHQPSKSTSNAVHSKRPGVRPSRSISSLGSMFSSQSTANSSSIPPVPRLPNKDLPPLPPKPHSAGGVRSTQAGYSHTQPPAPGAHHRKKRKQGPPPIEQPNLVHIPKLLPLFLEMTRPLLLPRTL